MSNRGVPAWASALNLTILFWVGMGLAPISAIIMLVSDSAGAFKLALICGLGSVILIGSSIAFRRDADDVEAELGDELEKLEMETRRGFAEIRTQLRQLTLDGPRPERAEVHREEPRGTRPIEARRDAAHMPRRPEAEFEDTGEMTGAEPPIPPRRARRAESRHEEYPSREERQYPRSEEDSGVYRSRGTASPRRALRAETDRGEADALLAGLGPGDGWEDAPVPRREERREEYRRARYDEPQSGAWGRPEPAAEPRRRRADRRIAERESEPQARWSDYEGGGRAPSYPDDDYYERR